MQIHNVEIKARCANPDRIRQLLLKRGARFEGADHQVDTYYQVQSGRLKLRQGKIENALIHYERPDREGPKSSQVRLFRTGHSAQLGEVLHAALPILTVVDKQREIYFIDHVKFHIDQVKNLGSFVEIEVIDEHGRFSREEMETECTKYLSYLLISEDDLLQHSYSDMLQE